MAREAMASAFFRAFLAIVGLYLLTLPIETIKESMSKGKLAKFADMERYENVFQYPFSVIDNVPFEMKGRWREMYFKLSLIHV